MDKLHEEWRPVAGYEGYYEVSNLGRVRSLPRIVTEKSGKQKRLRGRVLRGTTPNGYVQVFLSRNGKPKRFVVHRLVATAFIGARPRGYVVNHLDGDKANNVVENLEWTTPHGNAQHASEMGLLPRGESCSWSRLTEDDVRAIRRLAKVAPLTDVASAFSVSVPHVTDIVAYRRWKHVA